jgi:cob(I)alamin adenosyltransferase
MGHRLSRIYTRTGDDGTTGLGDGARVRKDDARVEAYGTVDEANSAIGIVLAVPGLPADVTRCLVEIQHDLFDLGGELSIPGHAMLTEKHVRQLERWLDHYNAALPPLKEFILPGGCRGAAAAHIARTVCRRAERELVGLRDGPFPPALGTRYLNRLSDLLFVLARELNRAAHCPDMLWQRSDPTR